MLPKQHIGKATGKFVPLPPQKGFRCGTDPRNEVDEVHVARKSSGVLTAVCTCHFNFAIQTVRASESCTQVVIFVVRATERLPSLRWVLYDNSCGVKRYIENQTLFRRETIATFKLLRVGGCNTVGDWQASLSLLPTV